VTTSLLGAIAAHYVATPPFTPATVFTTNTTSGGAVVEEWAGLDATAPHLADGAGVQTTVATATTLTDTITTSTANEWVWSALGTINQNVGLAGVGWALPQLVFTELSGSFLSSATAGFASGVYPTAGVAHPSVGFTAANSRYTGLVSMSFKTIATSRPQVAESVFTNYGSTASWAATLTTTPDPATDVLVVALWHLDTLGATSISGCGATWTPIETHDTAAGYDMHVWVGRGATTAGPVTVTSANSRAGHIRVLRVSGQGGTAAASSYARPNGAAVTGPVVTAGPGQVVLALMAASGTGLNETPLSSATPALGNWSVDVHDPASVQAGDSQDGWIAPTSPGTSHSVSGTASTPRDWPTTMVVVG
jgi:hypothetical protein